VVALALEEFIRRHQNRQLLDAINRAYETQDETDELERAPSRWQHHRRMVEGEW
jgi:hypothetical protein